MAAALARFEQRTLFVTGVNHRSAPLALRERLAYGEHEVVPALGRLQAALPDLSEAALISTCNRTELIGVASGTRAAAEAVCDFLAADRGVARDRFDQLIYRFEGRDAAHHLFRVGASLDSMVVGEPQILGQLKVAYAQATEADAAGLILHRAFHRAFAVAKNVRKGTLIGRGAVSVSSVAVSLAGRIFESLADRTVLLMGAGRTAELAARSLKRDGVKSLIITTRTFERAVALAHELGGTAAPYEHSRPYLPLADVIIGSLAVAQPVLKAADFAAVIKQRRSPVLLLDLGVPRNFDPEIGRLENVYLYDIDDLATVSAQSLKERENEASKAEAIVELEAGAFMRWLEGLDLAPAIKEIRSSIEQLRGEELARHQAWLAGLAPDQRERIEGLTRGLVNKLLHRVMVALRDEDDAARDPLYTAEVARRLLCTRLASVSSTPGSAEETFSDAIITDEFITGERKDDDD